MGRSDRSTASGARSRSTTGSSGSIPSRKRNRIVSMATFRDGNTLSTKIHYRNKHNQECLGHRGRRGNHCTETEGGKSIWQTAYKMRCQSSTARGFALARISHTARAATSTARMGATSGRGSALDPRPNARKEAARPESPIEGTSTAAAWPAPCAGEGGRFLQSCATIYNVVTVQPVTNHFTGSAQVGSPAEYKSPFRVGSRYPVSVNRRESSLLWSGVA